VCLIVIPELTILRVLIITYTGAEIKNNAFIETKLPLMIFFMYHIIID